MICGIWSTLSLILWTLTALSPLSKRQMYSPWSSERMSEIRRPWPRISKRLVCKSTFTSGRLHVAFGTGFATPGHSSRTLSPGFAENTDGGSKRKLQKKVESSVTPIINQTRLTSVDFAASLQRLENNAEAFWSLHRSLCLLLSNCKSLSQQQKCCWECNRQIYFALVRSKVKERRF